MVTNLSINKILDAIAALIAETYLFLKGETSLNLMVLVTPLILFTLVFVFSGTWWIRRSTRQRIGITKHMAEYELMREILMNSTVYTAPSISQRGLVNWILVIIALIAVIVAALVVLL